MNIKHWLIVYDIRNNKRLSKIARCVESYAWRVQKSVFESLASEETINKLKTRIQKIINKDEDFILFFEVCERDWQKKEIYEKSKKGLKGNENNDKFLIL